MAYAKNKNPKRTWRAKKAVFKWKSDGASRRVILTVIILAMMVVVLATLLVIFATPERTVKRKIEEMAQDYYENYFYENILKNSTAEIAEVMERYVQPGFAKVDLRQLTLYDNEKYAEARAVLETYCDLDKTTIKIYPEAPFSREDYRVEYAYSCAF